VPTLANPCNRAQVPFSARFISSHTTGGKKIMSLFQNARNVGINDSKFLTIMINGDNNNVSMGNGTFPIYLYIAQLHSQLDLQGYKR
jgi:hypothetical protein